MVSAFVVSCVFLVTYVLHKILMRGVHTPFGGEGAIRTIYYTMLISHIILAIVIVPLVLATLRYAVVGRIDAAQKMGTLDVSALVLRFSHRGPRLFLPLSMVSSPTERFGKSGCSRRARPRHSRG